MADFTGAQQASIRTYLGWSALFYLIDPRLQSQIGPGGLGTTQPDSAAIVIATLGSLALIDAAIADAALNNLTLSKAEDVNFLGPEQIEALKDQGRVLIQTLAIIFEVKPKRDYYTSEASSGGGMIEIG